MQAPTILAIRRLVAERWPLVASVVVLLWSLVETVSLAVVHTIGPELYGVLVAALSTTAAGANVALLRSPRAQLIVTAAVLLLWVLIAFGGIAGTIAHLVGPSAEFGPIDPRPRPIAAPLVFTLLGSVGGAALFIGQRMRVRSAATSEKE